MHDEISVDRLKALQKIKSTYQQRQEEIDQRINDVLKGLVPKIREKEYVCVNEEVLSELWQKKRIELDISSEALRILAGLPQAHIQTRLLAEGKYAPYSKYGKDLADFLGKEILA